MAPSSRFAASSKPSVAYLVLNFWASLNQQSILSSFVYAVIPYQSFGSIGGALALMIAWSRLAMGRSDPDIVAIFSSSAFSLSTLPAAAFSSLARSFIAAFSSGVNSLEPLLAVLFVDFTARLFAAFLSAIVGDPPRTFAPLLAQRGFASR
jgi:hypothetical protein